MILDTASKEKIVNAAAAAAGELVSKSEEAFVKALDTPFEIGLYNLLYDVASDGPVCTEERIRSLQLAIRHCAVDGNKIRFDVHPVPQLPEFGTPEYDVYLNNSYLAEDRDEAGFWEHEAHKKQFAHLPEFKAYEDIVITKNEVNKYRKRGHLFNVAGWLDYGRQLTTLFFPDFQYEAIKAGSLACFTKNIGSEWDLCITYDESAFKDNLKGGSLFFPELQVLLVPRGFDKQRLFTDWDNADAGFLVAGALQNPFTGVPCTPLDVFFARKTLVEKGPGYFEVENDMIYDQQPDGSIRVYNTDAFGLSLKQHLFFYMAANSYYVAPLIRFFEAVLK